jgi:cytochrome c553
VHWLRFLPRLRSPCHGLDGFSKVPESPNLAGQPDRYLMKALKEYQAGKRRDETIRIFAEPLSDADLGDLAAYYAATEVKVPN